MDGAIRDFIDYLDKERNFSPHTVRNYLSDLEQFKTFSKERGISKPAEVDHLAIREFMAGLRRGTDGLPGRKRGTVARKISTLRSFFRYLVQRGVLQRDPTGLIRSPRRARKLPNFLSEEEVIELITSVPEKGFIGLRDRAILEVLYASGVRVSEAVGADLNDLNLSAGFVRVRGKGKRERLAMLGAPAIDALRTYLAARRTLISQQDSPHGEALFVNARKARRLTTRSVRRILKGYLIQNGLNPEISPHAMRHSFATHLLNRGANLREVQELLGHKRISSTQIYTHVETDQMRKIYRETHPRSEKK